MNIPQPNPFIPIRGNRFSRWLGRTVLSLLGWDFEGELPETQKCLIIAAPHTSNWDFVTGLAAMLAIGLRASWMGKSAIFIWPIGYLWRWLGGIPTERGKNLGAVEQRVNLFNQHEQLIIGIAPEGTRSATHLWKTGFYHIAVGAKIPIFPIYWDYSRKVIGLLPLFHPTGDIEEDIKTLMALYQPYAGKFPENAQWQKH
jgi:1-acyl-sn-glycerol-3-phosphate acyltransferase